MNFYRIVLILILIWPAVGQAQSFALRDSVLEQFNTMRFASDSDKSVAASKLETLFSTYYAAPENFDHEMDSIPFLGQLRSENGAVRMLCWNLAFEDGSLQYHCVLRHRSEKKSVVVTVFQDSDADWRKLLRKPVRPNEWYGALYYKIIEHTFRGQTYYTLLGWDGNNTLTNRKIIDVLVIQGNTVALGASMFSEENRSTFRLIYEYANDVSMALNYDEKEKMIIMDHLAPEDSRFTGQYQFYGPDFSYDGLIFTKGKWVFKRDVFANNRGLNNLSKDQKPGSFED